MKPVSIEYKGYTITTDKKLMQVEAIHKWLSEKSYWVMGIPFHLVKTAFDNSFCAAVLKDGTQIGYSRLVTDYSTIAYLADVYIEEEHRGQGLSHQMLNLLLEQDWVKTMRKILLATLDAHAVYEPYGFKSPAFPERYMEISRAINYKELIDTKDAQVNS